MKKFLAILLSVVMAFGVLGVTAVAADSVKLDVTISDANGSLALAVRSVTVTDIDGDKALTINDALYCAHETYYPGGAAAGYTSSASDYGLSLMKLWGTANGGSYGYYLNDASAWSLLDTVKNGDFLYAFVYTDTKNLSDAYSFFDVKRVETRAFDTFELTLYSLTYDVTTWELVKAPVAGAVIEIDGEKTVFVTDENGKVSITLDSSGSHVISASSSSAVIVPPACIAESSTGGFFANLLYWLNTIVANIKAFIAKIFGFNFD